MKKDKKIARDFFYNTHYVGQDGTLHPIDTPVDSLEERLKKYEVFVAYPEHSLTPEVIKNDFEAIYKDGLLRGYRKAGDVLPEIERNVAKEIVDRIRKLDVRGIRRIEKELAQIEKQYLDG